MLQGESLHTHTPLGCTGVLEHAGATSPSVSGAPPAPNATIIPYGPGGDWHQGALTARSADPGCGASAWGSEEYNLNKNSNSCSSSIFLYQIMC